MRDKPLICAKCNVGVEVTLDPDPDVVTCPNCGQNDTFENVKRSIGEQAQERAAEVIQDTFRKAARGSKFLKFQPRSIPKRSHKFIVQFDE